MATKRFTDSAGKTFAAVVLNGKANYNVWAFTMKEHLKTAGLFDLVSDFKEEKEETKAKVQQDKAQEVPTYLNSLRLED